MNILIRKNFNAESGGRDRGHGKLAHRHRKSHGGGAHGHRSRDSVFCNIDDHCCSYRTHLFLNATNATSEYEDDTASTSTQNKSSFPLLRWAIGSIKRKSSVNKCDYLLGDLSEPSHNRKVSFEDGNFGPVLKTENSFTPVFVSTANELFEDVKNKEVTNLANINKDCFIIPAANLERFLPAGVPSPQFSNRYPALNFLKISDPKLSVVVHLMSQMEPLEPPLQSPFCVPLIKQKQLASAVMVEMEATKMATEGILLTNLEKGSAFPYIAYYVINNNRVKPIDFLHTLKKSSWRKFDPQVLRHTVCHTFDILCEVATIARPPLYPHSKKPKTDDTGYIVTIYRVFEGDDREKFEKNWLYWTGARMIYRNLPRSTGLRRITLHKSQSIGDKLYLLIVECSNFLQDFSATAVLLPALRARLCGYTGIYKSISVF